VTRKIIDESSDEKNEEKKLLWQKTKTSINYMSSWK
jgi:hypothetical protein